MVKQRSWGDCGVATLLNAIGDNGIDYYRTALGYECMVASLNGRDCGITMQEICSVLYDHGFLPVHIPLEGFVSASGIAKAKTSSIDIKAGLYNQWPKAIYQVKTKSGVMHFIYFDGCMIWDSSPGSPSKPRFSDYESVIDVVYILPNTPFSIYRNTDEITAFSEAHLQRHKEWIESSDDSYEKTAAQIISECEKRGILSSTPKSHRVFIKNTIDSTSIAQALESSTEQTFFNTIRANRL